MMLKAVLAIVSADLLISTVLIAHVLVLQRRVELIAKALVGLSKI